MLAGSNRFLKPISAAASGVAWIFSGAFFLIGAIVFAKERATKAKAAPEWSPTTREMGEESRREPSWAKYATSGSAEASSIRRGSLGEPIEDGKTESSPTAAVAKPTEWTIDLIRDLEWKRFEDVCQQFYETKGIRSETTALGPDGGIDIRLYQDDSGTATSIVQCKAWGERFVGVKPVRELLGVMTHEKIGKAFFMTSGYYSDEAKAVAKANRITLIDGDMLLMMLRRLPPEGQQKLLAFAVEGDYASPTCPSCGIKMKRIPGKDNRPDFWGCHNYPRCRQRLGVRRAS